jgi:hypothetical protein
VSAIEFTASWHAHFETDANGTDSGPDGSTGAHLVSYVLPRTLQAGDPVTLEDMCEPGLVGTGEFVGWREGASGFRYADIHVREWHYKWFWVET